MSRAARVQQNSVVSVNTFRLNLRESVTTASLPPDVQSLTLMMTTMMQQQMTMKQGWVMRLRG
jgi:hypothetical protein